jgi:ABC-type transport system substrate-binding protein
MRSRALSFLAVIGLIAAACSSTPATTQAPASSAAATAAASAPASVPATAVPTGATAADTLQFAWLGDCTCIWHPAAYETFSQAINFELMFSKLIERNWQPDGTWKPMGDLADSWDITPDGLTWTFHLHPGVKWQDGQPFSSSDVAFTINESFLYKGARYNNAAWAPIVGSADVTAGKTKTASGVKVIDPNTISITLSAPNADYFSDIADPGAVILPEHILKDTDPTKVETLPFSTTSPVGTGPYKFIKYETDQYSQFEANPDYFKGAPKIKNIFVKRLSDDQAVAQMASGDVDMVVRVNPADQEALSKDSNVDVLSTTGVGTYGPYFNMLTIKDRKTREAIMYAVDAQGIIDSIYAGGGHINKGVLPGMPPDPSQELFTYDPAKAKQLLDESSWDKSKPLRIIFDNSFAGVTEWTPIMQQNLEAIGFKVQLMGLDTATAVAQYDKVDTYDVTIAQGGDQGLSPFRTEQYYSCKQTDPAVWQTYSHNCAIDADFAAARKELDPTKRNAIFQNASLVINQELDKASWWTTNALSAKIKGLQGVSIPPNTREFIIGVQNWTLTR